MKALCVASGSVSSSGLSRLVLLTGVPTYLTLREVFTFVWTNVPTEEGVDQVQGTSPRPVVEGDQAAGSRYMGDIDSHGVIFEEACVLRGREPDTYSLLLSTPSCHQAQRIINSLKSLPIDGIDFSRLAQPLPVAAILERTTGTTAWRNSLQCKSVSAAATLMNRAVTESTANVSKIFPVWYIHALSHAQSEVSQSSPSPQRQTPAPLVRSVSRRLPEQPTDSDHTNRLTPPAGARPKLVHTTSLNDAGLDSQKSAAGDHKVDDEEPEAIFLSDNELEEPQTNDPEFPAKLEADIKATPRVVALGVSVATRDPLDTQLGLDVNVATRPELTPPAMVSQRTGSSSISNSGSSRIFPGRASTPSYSAVHPPSEQHPTPLNGALPSSVVPSGPTIPASQSSSSLMTNVFAPTVDPDVPSTTTPLHYIRALTTAAAVKQSPLLLTPPSGDSPRIVSITESRSRTSTPTPIKRDSLQDAARGSQSPTLMRGPDANASQSLSSGPVSLSLSYNEDFCDQDAYSTSDCPICRERLFSIPFSCTAPPCLTSATPCTSPVCVAAEQRPVLTIFCGHTFHFECLSHCTSSTCPLCRRALFPAIGEPQCAECGSTRSLWLCLLCGHLGCGRYVQSHANEHFARTGHALAMDFHKPTRVWDYVSDGFVSRVLAVKGGNELVAIEGDEDEDTPNAERTIVAVAEVAAAGASVNPEILACCGDEIIGGDSIQRKGKADEKLGTGTKDEFSTPSRPTKTIYSPGSSPLQLTHPEIKSADDQPLAREIEARLRRLSGSGRVTETLRFVLGETLRGVTRTRSGTSINSDSDVFEDGLRSTTRRAGEGHELDPATLHTVWATSLKLESVVQEYNQLLTTQMIAQRSYFEAFLSHAQERHQAAMAAGREELTRALGKVAEEEALYAQTQAELQAALEREAQAKRELEALQAEENVLREQLNKGAAEVAELANEANRAEANAIRALQAVSAAKDAEIRQLEEMLNDLRFSIKTQRKIRKSGLRDEIQEGRIVYP